MFCLCLCINGKILLWKHQLCSISDSSVEMMRFWYQICGRNIAGRLVKGNTVPYWQLEWCAFISLGTTNAAGEFWMNIFCLRAPPSGFLGFSFPLKCWLSVLLYSKLALQKNLAMQNAVCKLNHILLLPLLLIVFSFPCT